MPIGRDKSRVKEAPEVKLYTPYGTEVTVGRKRAEQLLSRPPVTFGDGKWRKYAESREDIGVKADKPVTNAPPPRAGTRANTGTGDGPEPTSNGPGGK